MSRWFCAIGSKEDLSFPSVQAARRFLDDTCPEILELTSEAEVAAFRRRRGQAEGHLLADVRRKAERLGPLWR
jgi:hypothetical protein